MIKPEIYRRIRNSICLIISTVTDLTEDYSISDLKYEILGTGFLFSNGIIITNNHVAKTIAKIPRNFVAFKFEGAEEGHIIKSLVFHNFFAVISRNKFPVEDEKYEAGLDLAFFLIDFSRCALPPPCVPVEFGTLEDMQIGQDIAICGYIYGFELLENINDPETARREPFLLQGHISGHSPYDNQGVHRPVLLWTDITNGYGLSGSPVFNTNGKVIGIHVGGLERVVQSADEKNLTNPKLRIPLGIGRAVPLSSDDFALLSTSFENAQSFTAGGQDT